MNNIQTGRICEIQKNTYFLKYGTEVLRCKLKGSFYNGQQALPVVGDYVDFQPNPGGDSVIVTVLPRKSVLKRPDYFHFSKNPEQVMCANFDYAFITASLNGNYNYNRIARYVSIVLQGNGIPVVLLTKADLCPDTAAYVQEIEALSDRVRVHPVSALYGLGLDELAEYLTPGSTIALLGSSGVGKSTLVNALAGQEIMHTSAIREADSKGRHTTTHRQLLELPSGAVIIDTPGMREIGMCDVDEGIDETFDDIVQLENGCRFGNCRHETEPGCAVKAAIAAGTLSPERLALYRSLHSESNKAAKLKQIAVKRRQLKGK